ncbi:MAG: hemolysin family protein [Kiritimatiellae bacterium]|nr:hemolysin family protein [Kiritimatiellia bacterium]MDW8457711.1 hemolysin family protein [Verrucomicrobiota bacterium]
MNAFELLVFCGLLVCSAFFSSSETMFFSLNPLQIRRLSQRNPELGRKVHDLLANPTRLLSTILIGNTIVNVAIAAVGYNIAKRLVPGFGEAVAIPVVTVLLIIFGEAGPKRFGLKFAERFAPLYAPVLEGLAIAFSPLRSILEALTKRFEALFRPRGRGLSEDEFKTVLEIGNEEGILNADELAMIKSIIQLEDMKVSDVMTPRVDIIGLDLDGDSSEFVAKARAARRNFLPLYRGQLENIEGFLNVRRFLLDPDHNVERAREPPFFVPETMPLNRLLLQFQNEHRRIAIVVDEYGGVAGLVTRGDILEEITGEIYQELNRPRPLFQPAGPNRWLMDANFSLEELNRKLGLRLEAEGVDRLAGWITHHLGHLPEKDDVVVAQGVRVTVLQTVRLRVTLAQLEKLPDATDSGEASG